MPGINPTSSCTPTRYCVEERADSICPMICATAPLTGAGLRYHADEPRQWVLSSGNFSFELGFDNRLIPAMLLGEIQTCIGTLDQIGR